jgi:hypothetical protein
MNKKGIFLLFVLVVIITGGVFAQEAAKEESGDSGIKNWASGEVSLLGIGGRYERMLTDKISIGGTFFFHSFFFLWNSLGITASARYYPWAGMFYAELGLGYGWVSGTEEYTYKTGYGQIITAEWVYTNAGVMLTPGVGWRIDFGTPGGFYINPMISLPIVFGMKDKWLGEEDEFGVGMNFRPAIGMGFAF